MLWIKALHLVFVAAWFAGLFYLPRIFVNLALLPTEADREWVCLLGMAERLLRFTRLLSLVALGLGFALWWGYGMSYKVWSPGNAWLGLKLLIVLGVLAYQRLCGRYLALFQILSPGHMPHGHRWYRLFNEIPVLALLACVLLVLFKPL
jgi:putative membrane protein